MLLVSLFACTTQDNFVDQLYALTCQRAEECDKGTFQQLYDDQAECLEESEDYIDDLEDLYEDCDFDTEEANECLNAIRKMDCEDIAQGDYFGDCDRVYDCD